ncbi:2-hydroxyacid dehydrogenase [Acetobacteraceae bacterium]|nr:2-hydroxyacid dehydrogenase [Acetobacteraceae bacterium]
MPAPYDASQTLLLDQDFKKFITPETFSTPPKEVSALDLSQNNPHIKAIITNFAVGVSEEILEKLPNLEIISVFGVGVDRLPLQKAKERKLKITTTAGVNADEVADTALMLLLNLNRHFLGNVQWMENGSWVKIGEPPLGHSIKGSKVGIAGFGAIGKAIAERLSVFGAEIRYFNRSAAQTAFKREDSIDSLADWADTLILALPGTQETQNIINENILKKLGANSVLINIARGSLIDEKALIEALKNKTIRGAGLDVFLNEPNINPAYLTLPNCVLQPHQGSATWETRQAMACNVVQNLQAHFSKRALLTPLKGFA